MSRHYERERALQHRLEEVLQRALPDVHVLEVELDDPQELVRVFVDYADGVGLDECEAVTRAIRDECPDHRLEVSSPGIERPLRAPAHFRAALGRHVRLRRRGAHRAGRFEIVAVDDSEGVTVRPEGGESVVVPFDEIVRCRLVVDDPFAAAGTPRGAKRKERGS